MAHKLTGLVPAFAVDDIERLCTFYEKSLGFVQDFRYGEPTYYVGLVKDVVDSILFRLHHRMLDNLREAVTSVCLLTRWMICTDG